MASLYTYTHEYLYILCRAGNNRVWSMAWSFVITFPILPIILPYLISILTHSINRMPYLKFKIIFIVRNRIMRTNMKPFASFNSKPTQKRWNVKNSWFWIWVQHEMVIIDNAVALSLIHSRKYKYTHISHNYMIERD